METKSWLRAQIRPRILLVASLLLWMCLIAPVYGKQVVIVLDEDEIKDNNNENTVKAEELPAVSKSNEPLSASESSRFVDENYEDPDDDEDDDDDDGKGVVDFGSWLRVVKEPTPSDQDLIEGNAQYVSGVKKLVEAVNEGDLNLLTEAQTDLEAAADKGHPHAQSTLAFLHGHGYGVEQSDSKAFLYHYFASEGGSYQSKMALAYNYFREGMHDKAVRLYAELAATAVAGFHNSKDSPLIDPVRLNEGSEESKEALKKFRGEEDDDFQFLEYQAQKGHPSAMYKLGIFYYLGLRGVQRDHAKALFWFSKAVEKGDSSSLEILGEIYARGLGVQRNFTKALEYFKTAINERHFSAYNGIGYLYFKGLGVEQKNYTKAREYFKKAADHGEPNGHYNLGVLHLKGKGVKKNVKEAGKNFVLAANQGHPKAYYQLAKMQQKGVGMKKDVTTAATLFKIVAERGAWGSMLRWALDFYLKGQTGMALLLYSRAAELGYEVAQSNAAWILEKFRDEDVCIGRSGFCTDAERHQKAHRFWRHASEQGNEHAALLIGDAYYYGRGTDKDLERAAEAYMLARAQQNAQAMFNLGYMHERGFGLPLDFHLAKRYYDQARETDSAAALPVSLALMSLWLRQHYGNSYLVTWIDMLPGVRFEAGDFFQKISFDDGNATLVTLIVCLLTVLYLRQRQRRRGNAGLHPAQ
ncbi:hypothetical protein O6H91_17G083700 [Diphasiastrum complanatum]|uniref:Uncharacterized protein n=2 Tax=Diphasiastrum complanatum TaxID=34168 RepID=A0ACC2B9J4_DIPCM|nr:hypothetical protein O6H91_17G083000 [Diphasiastrum complanatum]KAJ7526140.1 hypothetical protein O6H91_17G083700 [Diphasiastrum complanatum]